VSGRETLRANRLLSVSANSADMKIVVLESPIR
jgi:hypothetical protein